MPQRGDIDWRFPIDVQQFVMTGRYVHLGWFRGPTTYDYALVDETMARLGITNVAKRRISDLSGGQQQRALLARAIVQEAELLLLDEPFNNVDPETRHVICTILTELQQHGRASLVATHEISRLREDFDIIITLHASYIIGIQSAHMYQHSEVEL
jgi:manganese/zinc/iron transport system ATP- binding protein